MSLPDYAILRADLWWRLLPLLAALCISAVVTAGLGRLLTSRVRRRRLFPLGVHGTSDLEFVLAFPTFLMCVLVTVQIALMVNGQLIVDYAAFCAARSAAVWLPTDGGGAETPNRILPADEWSGGPQSEKWSRIHRAATIAVIPISPRITGFRFGVNLPDVRPPFRRESLAELAAAADARIAGGAGAGSLALAVFDKWPYAYVFTNVELLSPSGVPATEFSGTVTARVTHKLEMAVPFAGPLFGLAFGERYIPFIGGYCVPLSASYTLMLGHA